MRPRFRGDGPATRGPRVNRNIRISPVRVIGADNEQIGIIETEEALRIAAELGLDLVEVSPDARPPVCKIMDHGKHKYATAKRAKQNRATARASGGHLKEIRLGRSVKIGENDIRIRVRQARDFLIAGNKVQITQRFRGREMAFKELGLIRLAEIAEELTEVGKIEAPPRWAGRSASIVMAPDKAKVQSLGLGSPNEVEEAEETAAVETAAVETPAVETPAVETPAVETPAVKTAAVKTPAVETAAVETAAVETPAVEAEGSGKDA